MFVNIPYITVASCWNVINSHWYNLLITRVGGRYDIILDGGGLLIALIYFFHHCRQVVKISQSLSHVTGFCLSLQTTGIELQKTLHLINSKVALRSCRHSLMQQFPVCRPSKDKRRQCNLFPLLVLLLWLCFCAQIQFSLGLLSSKISQLYCLVVSSCKLRETVWWKHIWMRACLNIYMW